MEKQKKWRFICIADLGHMVQLEM